MAEDLILVPNAWQKTEMLTSVTGTRNFLLWLTLLNPRLTNSP